MRRNTSIIFSIFIFSFIFVPNAIAGGLSTTFGKVLVEDLPLGKAYSMQKESKTPLIIVNTSDCKVNLVIEVLAPQETELEQGFEPIPDISWIKVSPKECVIEPEKSVSSDVIISIPEDEQCTGKKYQVFIWSHTTGRSIGLGLKSKLLFTVRQKPQAEQWPEEL